MIGLPADVPVLKSIRRRLRRELFVCVVTVIGLLLGAFGFLPILAILTVAVFRRFYLYRLLKRNPRSCVVFLKTTGTKMNITPVATVLFGLVRTEHKIIGLINWPSYRGEGLILESSNVLILGVSTGRIYKLQKSMLPHV